MSPPSNPKNPFEKNQFLGHEKSRVTVDLRAAGPSSVCAILLAGGAARRMGGVNKALLQIRGRTIIEMATSVLSEIFSEILIITNSPDDFGFLGFPMHEDLVRGKGSLGGLYTGLSLCRRNWAFLAGCDMPFLNEQVIRHMVGAIGDAHVVIPRISGMLEPLHAIYSKACLPYMEELLERGDLKILDFLHNVRVREVSEEELAAFDPAFRFIMNLNSPQDLERARLIAADDNAPSHE